MTFELVTSYRLFQYESRFLAREVSAFGGRLTGRGAPDGKDVLKADGLSLENATNLTYVARIRNGGPHYLVTRQGARESRTRKAQPTRYGPHGLHEYKGKFNPQTPRSLILQHTWADDLPILDPFVGSGTTLIEARHLGFASEGIELNPFAKALAEAKLAWELPPRSPVPDAPALVDVPAVRAPRTSRAYLERWFPPETLTSIERILGSLQGMVKNDRLVAEIVLSNLLRDYSWQEPRDLRIRRRTHIPKLPEITEVFSKKLREQWAKRQQWVDGNHTFANVSSRVYFGDSGSLVQVRGSTPIGGTVCSPPYATALPYVDTYRLSMVALGLTRPDELLRSERLLLGARDIRAEDEAVFSARLEQLPSGCRRLLARLKHEVTKDPNAGFRRQAVPFAVARYLDGIRRVMEQLRLVEQRGAPNLWIVGSNRTTLNGNEQVIQTPMLLSELARQAGFRKISVEELDAFSRFSIHSKNSIRSEHLVRFYG